MRGDWYLERRYGSNDHNDRKAYRQLDMDSLGKREYKHEKNYEHAKSKGETGKQRRRQKETLHG